MARKPNTDKVGNAWTEHTKKNIWEKGRIIPKYSSSLWRWDKCGTVMKWTEFGNRKSEYGWEIDHIYPQEKGGGDDYNNLQPLNWKNNASKSDKLDWTCS